MHFAQLPVIKIDAGVSEVFEWYRKKKNDFPKIWTAARLLMSVPCTSVSSERLFSKATALYANKLRNRLNVSQDRAQQILLIKACLNDLKLAPSIESISTEDETEEMDQTSQDIEIE